MQATKGVFVLTRLVKCGILLSLSAFLKYLLESLRLEILEVVMFIDD